MLPKKPTKRCRICNKMIKSPKQNKSGMCYSCSCIEYQKKDKEQKRLDRDWDAYMVLEEKRKNRERTFK